jgi:hypothetical protein
MKRIRIVIEKDEQTVDLSEIKCIAYPVVGASHKSTKEKGCTEPLYGKKAKCVINIVPQEDKSATFQMDKKCIKTRG